MYSWGDDLSDWVNPSAYKFKEVARAAREADAARAAAHGPRTYEMKHSPERQRIDPKKRVSTQSPNPLIVAVDVTGSMSSWPFEIFDRLPLLYQTLSQYRPDLEVSFAAIGDAVADRWPLQVTTFAKGYDLEQNLKALYGEGGGGDSPESYGLFAHWVNTHVSATAAKRPFLIVYGDVSMHPTVSKGEIAQLLGDQVRGDVDAIGAWQEAAKKWSTWFLRRPGGVKGDETDQQWGQAIGAQHVVHVDSEPRAVDYALGLIARTWGHFDDFRSNMLARQQPERVRALESELVKLKVG